MKIIVTGASRGIGKEVVKRLLMNEQYSVLAIARNENKLRILEEEITSSEGGRLLTQAGDISDKHFREEIEGRIKQEWGACDVLLNNAGQLINLDFDQTGLEQAKSLFEVNVFAAMDLTRRVLPLISEGGHVVNIGSMGGYSGSAKFPGLSWYSASKAAIACLTECLAEEYKEKGVSFNCLALGAVQTEMLSEAFPTYKAPMSAEEMAKYVADFCVGGQRYYNGKVLPVSVSTP